MRDWVFLILFGLSAIALVASVIHTLVCFILRMRRAKKIVANSYGNSLAKGASVKVFYTKSGALGLRKELIVEWRSTNPEGEKIRGKFFMSSGGAFGGEVEGPSTYV